jgi:hypothetical protein
MFKKLAKVRSLELWLTMPQRGAVRPPFVACNDNRAGLVRPMGPRPRQSPAGRLTCRWLLSPDGRLECRWDLPADGRSRDGEDPPAAAPAHLRRGDSMNILEVVAGEQARRGRGVPPAACGIKIKNKPLQCR